MSSQFSRDKIFNTFVSNGQLEQKYFPFSLLITCKTQCVLLIILLYEVDFAVEEEKHCDTFLVAAHEHNGVSNWDKWVGYSLLYCLVCQWFCFTNIDYWDPAAVTADLFQLTLWGAAQCGPYGILCIIIF